MPAPAPADQRLRPGFVTVIAAIMALNALGISVLLPGLPQLGAELGVVGANDQQFAVGVYMLGIGFGTLFFGPVSDRFGRRGPLFAGLVVYVLAAVLAAGAQDFASLLGWRALQGFGAASTRVVVQSAVRDRYAGPAMAQVLSTVFIVLNVVPILSPAIGQAVLLLGPWRGILLVTAAAGFVVGCAAWLFMPETLAPERRRPLSFGSVIGGFGLVFGNRVAMCYALAGLALFGGNFAFTTMSQQIYVETYGLGPWFALAFAMNGVVMSFANLVTIRYARRLGMRMLVHGAIVVWIAAAALLTGLALLGPVPLAAWMGLVAILMFMFGICGSNMMALALEPLGRVAGTAASVFGFLQSTGSGLLGSFIGQQYDGTVLPMSAAFLGIGVAMLAFSLAAEGGRLFPRSAKAEAADAAPAE